MIHNQNPSVRVVEVVCLLLLWVGCTTAPTDGKADDVRIALTKSPISYLPVYLARELGYYRDEGLNVMIDDLSGATKPMQSLLAGSADVAALTYEQLLPTVAHGEDLRCFYMMLRYRTQALVAAPAHANTVGSVRDLRGKTIGVSSLGGPNHTSLLVILRKAGISAADVNVVQVGTMASLVAALEHGSVAAAMVNSSEFQVLRGRHADLRILFNVIGPEGSRRLCGSEICPTTVLAARQLWLDHNANTARKLARAIQRTISWIQQHSPEQVRDRMPETYRMEPAEADLAALKLTIPGFSADGHMTSEASETVRRWVLEAYYDEEITKLDLLRTYNNNFITERP